MTGETVVRGVEVSLAREKAFGAWHRHIHLWWPASHRLSGDPASRMVFEPCAGGRIFERATDGREFDWGLVEVWEPPERIVHTWQPGGPRDRRSRVTIEFTPIAAGRTRVRVTHTPGELAREEWERAQARFTAGWDAIVKAFANPREVEP
ncbi:MAG: SRPBCC domain-containing protein [Acidimicrobiales bacterium]|nr:SRPBCC domain-containing protein [Acidimicrobiales bacterium]